MAAEVYFKAIDSYINTQEIKAASKLLLATIAESKDFHFGKYVPLKVHFGEKGNKTYIASENYEGIIEYLNSRNIGSAFIETNALYSGSRMTGAKHRQLAKEHGFTQLPIVIADGEYGENFEAVEINKKHFQSCKIAKEIASQKQMIVLSHFKGHKLAGFGGAIKQLAMGGASRAGKLEQHTTSKPFIIPFLCKKCGTCARYCPAKAISIGIIPWISRKKCTGCSGCMAICPRRAILCNFLHSFSHSFPERLAEYAYASQKSQNNIYISFALNITKGCDCEGHPMTPAAPDIGIFASTDPVAIDQACLDMLDQKTGEKMFFSKRYQLDYAQEIGIGQKDYNLIRL